MEDLLINSNNINNIPYVDLGLNPEYLLKVHNNYNENYGDIISGKIHRLPFNDYCPYCTQYYTSSYKFGNHMDSKTHIHNRDFNAYHVDDYEVDGFLKSRKKNKMYEAILINKTTNEIVSIHFGDDRHLHYKDVIGEYDHLDHNIEGIRESFKARHNYCYNENEYTPLYFAWNYLW